MRKQTKLVAVASAAALLAIGASMTSFAATGWVEEDGQWYFYDKDGNRVEDEWKKSGDNWYWLDSEEAGAMAIDKLIEDDDNVYYVDGNGVMVRNTWVKVVNEDQDDVEDPAEYNYYYMQSNGKAYKASEAGNTNFKTIDGKRYAFDEDGKMLYGWLNADSTKAVDESDWEQATYYCGSWEDGALKTGWQKIYVYDAQEDEDMEHWFNFKSNGKKRVAEDGEIAEAGINGKKYGFDDRGVMTYEWTNFDTASMSTTTGWKYFNNPEDGARVTKGWFKVVAPNEDNDFGNVIQGAPTASNTFDAANAADETEKWYYADGSGNLAKGVVKKIKGKYYAFDNNGAMLSGLVLMKVDGTNVTVYDGGVDSDDLDLIMSKDEYYDKNGTVDIPDGASLYYFGDDADTDGAMKTGAVTVDVDGDAYNFLFRKTGGAESKGKGLTGIDSKKYIYKYGQKIKASSDDKYIAVTVTDAEDIGKDGEGEIVSKVNLVDARDTAADGYRNKDGETVEYVENFADNTYLVGTSGAIVKNKSAAKDGNDWYFYVEDSQIILYTNNKVLAPLTHKDEAGNVINDNNGKDLSDWKNWQ